MGNDLHTSRDPQATSRVRERVLEPEVMDTAEESLEYERMDHAAPNEAVVNRLAQLKAHGRMLDLGCGPGHIPVGVCERFSDSCVVGLDMSFEMLKLAQVRVSECGLRDRVHLVIGDVKRLPCADDSYDTVYSNTTLHHIPEPRRLLCEAWRVLRQGGVLLIRDLYRPESERRRDELVDMYAPLPQNTPKQRRLLAESLDAALTPQELQTLAQEEGMKDFYVTVDTDRHMTLQIKF